MRSRSWALDVPHEEDATEAGRGARAGSRRSCGSRNPVRTFQRPRSCSTTMRMSSCGSAAERNRATFARTENAPTCHAQRVGRGRLSTGSAGLRAGRRRRQRSGGGQRRDRSRQRRQRNRARPVGRRVSAGTRMLAVSGAFEGAAEASGAIEGQRDFRQAAAESAISAGAGIRRQASAPEGVGGARRRRVTALLAAQLIARLNGSKIVASTASAATDSTVSGTRRATFSATTSPDSRARSPPASAGGRRRGQRAGSCGADAHEGEAPRRARRASRSARSWPPKPSRFTRARTASENLAHVLAVVDAAGEHAVRGRDDDHVLEAQRRGGHAVAHHDAAVAFDRHGVAEDDVAALVALLAARPRAPRAEIVPSRNRPRSRRCSAALEPGVVHGDGLERGKMSRSACSNARSGQLERQPGERRRRSRAGQLRARP